MLTQKLTALWLLGGYQGGGYLQLLPASTGFTEDLVIVDLALLRPQQRHGRVRGVDGIQGSRRRRLCNKRQWRPTVKRLWNRTDGTNNPEKKEADPV